MSFLLVQNMSSLYYIGFAAMLVSSVVHCIAVLIFQLLGVHTLSPVPACPASCVCEKSLLVNCASLGLSKAPSHIPASTTALDLSHNALHSLAPLGSSHVRLRGLQHLWLGNNSMESLSMCSGMTRRKHRCVSWAPDLYSLSADRNQLKRMPRGENLSTHGHAQTISESSFMTSKNQLHCGSTDLPQIYHSH